MTAESAVIVATKLALTVLLLDSTSTLRCFV